MRVQRILQREDVQRLIRRLEDPDTGYVTCTDFQDFSDVEQHRLPQPTPNIGRVRRYKNANDPSNPMSQSFQTMAILTLLRLNLNCFF